MTAPVDLERLHAAARVLRRSCPDPLQRGAVARLLESLAAHLDAVPAPVALEYAYVVELLATPVTPVAPDVGEVVSEVLAERERRTRQFADLLARAVPAVVDAGQGDLAAQLNQAWALIDPGVDR